MIEHLLVIVILLSALLHLRADHLKSKSGIYVFKPLTTALIILVCLLQAPETTVRYKHLILAGLVFSLAGDIFLMLPSDRFISGLVSFLLAHVFYIVAFVVDSGWHLDYVWLVPVAILGVILLKVLVPHTGSLTIPVAVYALTLMLVLWQALGRASFAQDHSATMALAGTILFIVSDSLLAINRFVRRVRSAQTYIMTSYYLAQVLIAFSA